MNAAESIARVIDLLPNQVPYNPQRHHIEDAAAKLSKTGFQGLIGCFTGLALISASGRIVFHMKRRGHLFADDWLVILASCCLVVATGFLCYVAPNLYLMDTLDTNPKNIALFTKGEIQSLLGTMKWLNLCLAFSWTATFAIKMSFLAFFKTLIKDVSRGSAVLWWIAVVFTSLSWLFNILENPLNCGWNTGVKCSPYPFRVSEIGWVCSANDVATDLMIISIPIILLRKSLLRLSQKLRILAFLCLNAFCIAIAVGRTVGGVYYDQDGQFIFRVVYTFILMHLESCIAVIMGGITAFRTVFAAHFRNRERRVIEQRPFTWNLRIIPWLRRTDWRPEVEHGQSERDKRIRHLQGPTTGATMRGLRTFIRRYEREPGHTTCDDTMDDSQYNSLPSYHEYKREATLQPAPTTSKDQNPRGAFRSHLDDSFTLQRPLPVLRTHKLV